MSDLSPELPPLAGPLGELRADGLAELTSRGTWQTFRVGAVILEQGTPNDDVHIVAEGRVRIILRRPEDRDALLAVRGPGAALGDMSLLNESRRSASVLAIDVVRTLRVDGAAFLDILRSQPEVMFAMLAVLSRRLRDAERRLVDLGTHSVKTRLARRLLEHAVGAVHLDDDQIRVEVPLTREELATWVEATPTEVADAMESLRRTRLIESWGTGLAITDLDGLRVAALM